MVVSSLWCSVGQMGTQPCSYPHLPEHTLSKGHGHVLGITYMCYREAQAWLWHGCASVLVTASSLPTPAICPITQYPFPPPSDSAPPGAPHIVVDFSIPGDLGGPSTHEPPASLASSPMSLTSAHFSPHLCVPS